MSHKMTGLLNKDRKKQFKHKTKYTGGDMNGLKNLQFQLNP